MDLLESIIGILFWLLIIYMISRVFVHFDHQKKEMKSLHKKVDQLLEHTKNK
ncbi:BH3988 [Halalkalibacterium halodurans C-125]|uniref:BH3988 protein n=1 Tax=Halalkalibacterium halodurans (strain ATCC BAA-125 / DSM 18197 / FERM 7344 / JCM 9153 / C-125) TaxID=272558 RepID=Q9K5V0_HALH5|nr:BH3988 [Halalkalibacterium halodurans C-125]